MENEKTSLIKFKVGKKTYKEYFNIAVKIILLPASVFNNNRHASRFWFFSSLTCLVLLAVQPYFILEAASKRKFIVSMKDAGIVHTSPFKNYNETDKMIQTYVTTAALAILQRSPYSLDHDLVNFYCTKTCVEKYIKPILRRNERLFREKQIHQKMEISSVETIKENATNYVSTVKGQLIRTGLVNGHVIKFPGYAYILKLRFKTNENIYENGLIPYVVTKVRLKTYKI